MEDYTQKFDPRFKIFHELMARKVREVLLVSTPYDAWIMEEDCRLSEAIINEYRGLNLSHPPRLNWVSSTEAALKIIEARPFDLVIIMPRMADLDAIDIADRIKAKKPDLPIMLLCHQTMIDVGSYPETVDAVSVDRSFVWSGNTDLLLALIKNAEDLMNVSHDTTFAGIRVIIFIDDSPEYMSAILPLLYRELVIQTQAVMGEGLNEEHRLLAMRARPKILVAESYEEALQLFRQFEPNVLGVISDVRFPREGRLDGNAGIDLLRAVKKERFDIPCLLISAEPENAVRATSIPAVFVDKNSPSLLANIRSFFVDHLGFGDFVFRTPAGIQIDRAPNLMTLEKKLEHIPDDSFVYHTQRNDFSRWLFARAEIELASRVRPVRGDDFSSVASHREFLISVIHERRMQRQKGIVVNFDPNAFDVDSEFFRIGSGSLGGKARGLAFMSTLLNRHQQLTEKFASNEIVIPQTLVLTTDIFDAFIDHNGLRQLAKGELEDGEIGDRFSAADFPDKIVELLRSYLDQINYPLAVRSSSLLEDAQFRAYAGLYMTYMLANDHPDLDCRLEQLLNAIKMVYASTYFHGPKAFSKRVGHRTEEEKMAVIIQRLVGTRIGNHYYPAISGVAQSYNYYPFSKMKPEDGIATIALGLGRAVMEGEKTLRFSPRYPQLLPQRSTVDDILNNSQRHFYALKVDEPVCRLGIDEGVTLSKREISDAAEESPVAALASTYIPSEHRIRDSAQKDGFRVMTFAPVLKYDLFPLAEIIDEVLAIAQEGMGCPVELEFSVDLNAGKEAPPLFAILQVRPMSARQEMMTVDIEADEMEAAFCVSLQALGNTIDRNMCDVVYVKPDSFDPACTPEIASQISRFNAALLKQERKYLLVGPGRWGSADRWLGIPVTWAEICGVGAIIETAHAKLNADPSQGSHFFHNITSLGINYLTVHGNTGNRIDWQRLTALAPVDETEYVAHVRLDRELTLKVDGRRSQAVVLFG